MAWLIVIVAGAFKMGFAVASANVLGRVRPGQKLAALRALTLWHRFSPGGRDGPASC